MKESKNIKDAFASLDKFKGKRIFIVGDVMLDKYIWGDVERISPEAPVQVVSVNKESYVPGGAANVANNVASLGGEAILVGIAGDDEGQRILNKELKKRNIKTHLIIDDRPTIQKVRIVAQNQQLIRVDYEDKKYIEEHVEDKVVDILRKEGDLQVIIISDYIKGMVTENLVRMITEYAKSKKIPVIVDPKPKHLEYYKNIDVMTPNLKEAFEMSQIEGKSDKDIEIMGKYLYERTGANVLLTRGKDGMSLIRRDGETFHIPTKAKEVFDVSGAGDTVVAALALSIASQDDLKISSIIANHAAGVVVGKVGTSTANIDEIKRSLENDQ